MHVEGNRCAFLPVINFKIFVNELYWVRMYEGQTYNVVIDFLKFPQTKTFIKIP